MDFKVKNYPGAIIVYDENDKTVMAYDEESAHKNFDYDKSDCFRNSYSEMYHTVYSTWLLEAKMNYSKYTKLERDFLANTMTAFCVSAVRNTYPECQQKQANTEMTI